MSGIQQDPTPKGAPNTTRFEFSVYGTHDEDERVIRAGLKTICDTVLKTSDGLQVQPYRNERTGRGRYAAQITVPSVDATTDAMEAAVAEIFVGQRVDVDAFRFYRG